MFECIFVGDTGSGNEDQIAVAKSMKRLISKNPIQTVIIVGDNIYPDGCSDIHDTQFNTKFRDIYQNINLPFYLCLGNHDYHTNPQSQIDYTYSQYNNENKYFKKWNLPRRWYTQSFGSCDMFFIDTNFKHLSESVIQKGLRDTIQSIGNSKKRWKILCGHHTWRSVGGHGNAEKRHEEFMDDLLKSVDIDIYICGHDHCKSLINVGKYNIPTLVVGTGGKKYDNSLVFLENTNYDNSRLDFFSPNLGVCHMKCDNKSMSLTCYNELLQKEYHIKL